MRNKITYLNYTFDAKKIARATIGLEQSLPILTLGIDTFECEVKCPDKSILQFEQNIPLRYFHRKRQMGIYYVQSIERVSPDHFSFAAISTLGLLEQMDFYGGIYTGETVAEVVASICGNIPYIIKTNLQNIKLYGWLGIMSARLALQQVLFAIGANLVTDANGVLRIENLWDGISGVLDRDRIYADGASVKQDTPYTSVTVLEHQYIPGTERKDLFAGTTLQGQRIPFDGPMSNLQAEGFTVLESGANYALVSAGSGKLTGVPYIHTTLEVTKPVTNAPVKNEKRIEDATLVSLVNSNAVAERLAAYYACREVISVSAKVQQEHPGQVVQIYHPYDKEMVQAAIDTSSINVSGALKTDLTALVNFLPPQVQQIVTYDNHEVIIKSGEWMVPDGCTKVRAILIGGGDRGGTATNGTSGGAGGPGYAGVAGRSGTPGEAGSGGKILDVTIDVTPGQVLPITIGHGGNADVPQGQPTLFGGHSSEDGSASPIGYTDVVDGQIYAVPGEAGLVPDPKYPGSTTGHQTIGTFLAPSSGNQYLLPPQYQLLYLQVGTGGLYDGNTHLGYPKCYVDYVSVTEVDSTHKETYWDLRYIGREGFAGLSPEARADATIPGGGGSGGHAGGGGGGALGYSASYGVGATIHTVQHYSTTLKWIARRVQADTASGGRGGIAGAPGNGAHGVLILYFGVEKTIKPGALVTKEKNFFCDASGRLIIT